MLIDRRRRNDFSAVYGQQFAETGQIIACASPAVDAKARLHARSILCQLIDQVS